MRVSKVRLFEDTGIGACWLGREAIGLGSHVVSSEEEAGCAVGLVFTFGFVWASGTSTGAEGSPQVVCGGTSTGIVLDGWAVCARLHLSIPKSV